MKTTVEIPDGLFREAKTAAARRGLSLKTFLTEALKEKLSARHPARKVDWPVPPPKLTKGEMRRIQAAIDEEFSRVDPAECRQHHFAVASRDRRLDKVNGLRRVMW